eukprot:scaffold17647_cov83-Skeletonema_dohrnii-CCMP3373.AAC.8
MKNRNHRLRSASFDITSLHYYYSHCQPPPPLLDGDESQFTKKNCNSNKFRKSHSVQDLPSQLEFQIELKLTRRLKLMKEEGGANNNEEVVVGGGCAVESMECNETESDEEFIGEVENDDESIGEHYLEGDFTEDELVKNLLRRQSVVEQEPQQQCTLQEENENNNDEYTANDDYESSFMEWRRTTDCSEDTPRVGNVSSHLVVGVVDDGMECCNKIEVERVAAESDNVGNETSSSQDRIEEQSLSSQIATDDTIIMPPTINKKSARHGWIREMVGEGDQETKSDMEAGLNKQDEGKNGGIAGKIGSVDVMTSFAATNTITAHSIRLGAQDVDVVATKSESDDVGDSLSNQHQEKRNEEDQSPSPQPTTDDDIMQSPMEEKNERYGLIRQMVGDEEQQLEKKGDERDEEDKKGNGQVRVTKEAISGSDDIPPLSATSNKTISSRTSTATTTATSVATTSHISSKTNNNKSNNDKMDVLTEGQYFLSISML